MSLSIRWQIATAVMVVSLVALAIGSAVALVDSKQRLEGQRDAALLAAEDDAGADLATLWYRSQGRILGLEASLGERTDDASFGEAVTSLGILDGDMSVVALVVEGDVVAIRPPGAVLDRPYDVTTPSGRIHATLDASALQTILARSAVPLGPGGVVSWVPNATGHPVDGLGGSVIATSPPVSAAQMYSGFASASGTGLIVAGGTFLGGLVVAGLVLRPLRDLQRTVDGLVDGDETKVTVRGAPEFQAIAKHIQSAATQVRQEREASTRLQQELDGEVQRRGQALLERDATLAALFQGISHDVKGPLISATALMGRLDRNVDEEMRQEIIDRCAQSLRRLGHAVDQMVLFSRALRLPDNRDGDIAHVLQSCVATARRRARGMGRNIHSEGGHIEAHCDIARLEAAVQALLENAFRHGGNVHVQWSSHPPVIVIEDDGPGIPYSVQDLVEPYMMRADAPGAMAGMGIAIAHRMIVGMGGSLDIQTGSDGTRCTITLAEVQG